MAKVIPIEDLRNQTATVLAAVRDDDSVVVTSKGVPVAEIRPYRPGRRSLVPKADVVPLAASGPPLDPRLFREDQERFLDQTW